MLIVIFFLPLSLLNACCCSCCPVSEDGKAKMRSSSNLWLFIKATLLSLSKLFSLFLDEDSSGIVHRSTGVSWLQETMMQCNGVKLAVPQLWYGYFEKKLLSTTTHSSQSTILDTKRRLLIGGKILPPLQVAAVINYSLTRTVTLGVRSV